MTIALAGTVVTDDRVFAALARRCENLERFWPIVDKGVTLLFQRRFASEGAWGGRRWARLRPLTLNLRSRRGRGRGGILRDTGRLWGSFVKSGGPDSIRVMEPKRYERGSRLRTAALHQRGWQSAVVFGRRRRRPVRVPARPVMPERVPPEVARSWEQALVRWLGEAR